MSRPKAKADGIDLLAGTETSSTTLSWVSPASSTLSYRTGIINRWASG